jgi:GxxExxY protein
MTEEFFLGNTTGLIIQVYRKMVDELGDKRYSLLLIKKALYSQLRNVDLKVKKDVETVMRIGDTHMGGYKAHLLVDDQVLVQLFYVPSGLASFHRSQIRTILIDGSWPVGLGLNFGATRWDSIRVENRVVFPLKEIA